MRLEELLRYLDFSGCLLEVWHNEKLWRFSEFDTVPDRFMLKRIKYFAPKSYGGKYTLEVVLFGKQ